MLVISPQEKAVGLIAKADDLLATAQPAAVHRAADDDEGLPALKEAKALFDEGIKLAPLDAAALANRAACSLYLGEPHACTVDCDKALAELDADEKRVVNDGIESTGPFAPAAPPPEVAALITGFSEKADTLRFGLLRRRAAGRVELSALPDAAKGQDESWS